MGFLLSQDRGQHRHRAPVWLFSISAQTQGPEQLLPAKLLIFSLSVLSKLWAGIISCCLNPSSEMYHLFCSRISTPALIFLHGYSWHGRHGGKMSKVKKCRGLYFLSHHQAAGQASPKINVPCPYPHPSLASPGKYPGMTDGEPKFLHQLHRSVIPQHPRLRKVWVK